MKVLQCRALMLCPFLACSLAGSVQEAFADEAPESCTHLSPHADEHTCQHGFLGPFASVGSTPYPDGTPSFSLGTTHTLYTVALSGEAGDNQSGVIFTPSKSGAFAFYLNADYPFALLNAEGIAVPLRLANNVPACPEYYGWFHVYEDLLGGEPYTVVLGPSEEVFVQVVIESLDGFLSTLFQDADDDAFGDESSPRIRSWCGAATGYSLVSGDCNDDDPAVFPGAEEVCNGMDDDCDGEIDESGDALCAVGASCMDAHGCSGPHDGCEQADCSASTGGTANNFNDDSEPDEGAGGSGARADGHGGEDSHTSPNPSASGPDSSSGCSYRHSTGTEKNVAWYAWLPAALMILRRRFVFTRRTTRTCRATALR